MKHQHIKNGQVLLIIIMVLATVLTIVLSISFKSSTDTQITRLEQESKRTLAAAEAAIDVALQKQSGTTISLDKITGVPGFSGQATVSSDYSKSEFVTPLLQKDEQYTFYVSLYPGFTSPYNGTITIYYDSAHANCSNSLALEITAIYDDPATPEVDISRYIADTGDLLGTNTRDIGNQNAGTIDGVSFGCSTSPIDISTFQNAKVLFVRSLKGASRIGFRGSVTPLKPQGKYVVSQAQSTSGTSKTVQLSQSYPLIPAEFFVTSFAQ